MCFQFLYLISFFNRPLRVDIEFSITTLSSDYKHIKLFQIKKHIPNRIAENSNGKVNTHKSENSHLNENSLFR
jgi:hypothetical protein|tara:strand:- start:1696 stop:1914 length:219 start_codon:yes stop_codon:yes gene_type:complete